MFVHKDVFDSFVAKFTKLVQDMKVGLPWEKAVSITPLPENNKTTTLNSMVQDAVQKGAQLVCGGHIAHTSFTPAVVAGVTKAMKLYSDEQYACTCIGSLVVSALI